MASKGVTIVINDDKKEKTEKVPPEKEEAKASCYEETIWDDWDDEEVDKIYGKIYRHLR